jgi:multidrug efflux system membrane fusion protein
VQRGSQGNFVVVVQDDGTVKSVAVQLSAVQDDRQAIQSDELKEGDSVVTDGADRLRSGSKVEVVKAAKP